MEEKETNRANPLLPKKREDVPQDPKTLWLIRTVAALALGIMIGYIIWGVDWDQARENYAQRAGAAAPAPAWTQRLV